MVAAPLLTVGVPVNLPKAGAQALTGDDEPLAISVNQGGQIFIEETEVNLRDLVPRLKALIGTGYDQRIYVRGDRDVAYGRVAAVVARINNAGFTRVALLPNKIAGVNRSVMAGRDISASIGLHFALVLVVGLWTPVMTTLDTNDALLPVEL